MVQHVAIQFDCRRASFDLATSRVDTRTTEERLAVDAHAATDAANAAAASRIRAGSQGCWCWRAGEADDEEVSAHALLILLVRCGERDPTTVHIVQGVPPLVRRLRCGRWLDQLTPSILARVGRREGGREAAVHAGHVRGMTLNPVHPRVPLLPSTRSLPATTVSDHCERPLRVQPSSGRRAKGTYLRQRCDRAADVCWRRWWRDVSEAVRRSNQRHSTRWDAPNRVYGTHRFS